MLPSGGEARHRPLPWWLANCRCQPPRRGMAAWVARLGVDALWPVPAVVAMLAVVTVIVLGSAVPEGWGRFRA